MRRFSFLLIALLATVPLARSFAADRSFAAEGGFKTIHVADLAAMMAKPGAKVAIYDADPPSVRNNEGIIPGAKLLSSSSNYDVAKELPPEKDAKLVFYCHNTF